MIVTKQTLHDGRSKFSVHHMRRPEIEFYYYRSYLMESEPVNIGSDEIASLSKSNFQIDVFEDEFRPLSDWPQIVDFTIKFISVSIAAGFFGQIGSDIYSSLKTVIKKIAPIKKDSNSNDINSGIHFIFETSINQKKINVKIAIKIIQIDLLGNEPYSFESLINFIEKYIEDNNSSVVLLVLLDYNPYWEVVHNKYLNSD